MSKTITGKRAGTKSPPRKATKNISEHSWRSPRNHKQSKQLDNRDVGGHKRGSGPVNRGKKMGILSSPSGSENSSDEDSESEEGGKNCHDLFGRQIRKTES